MSRTLCLDISTKCGYAVINELGVVEDSGVITAKEKVRGQSINLFLQELNKVLEKHKPSEVVIEKPFFRGAGTRILFALTGVAELLAFRYNANFSEVHNTKIKKFMTSNARASKQEMIDKVVGLGYNPQDDNEADAISLALYSKNIEI